MNSTSLCVSHNAGSRHVFQAPPLVPCNCVCPTFYHLLLRRTARDQSRVPGASRTRMHYQSCVRLCVAQGKKINKKILVECRSKGKGHQRENHFQLVRGGLTCPQIQEARPRAVVRVCALATTGSVTGNIRRNWSPDPGFRHLKCTPYTSESLLFLSPPSLSSPKTRNSLQKLDTLSQSAHAESDESRKNTNAAFQRAVVSLFPRGRRLERRGTAVWAGRQMGFGVE